MTDNHGYPEMPAHPAAALWPMIDAEALDELAEDIRANGLIHPLVRWVDDDGAVWLLDGRNRAEACRRAGVEPTFVNWEGDDPAAYVLSANEHRRHLTPSQRAMLHVQLKRFKTLEASGDEAGVSHQMIHLARKVAEHAPELVAAVIAGTIPVKRAADEADRQRSIRERQTSEQTDDARWLDYVRSAYPDLAESFLAGDSDRQKIDDLIEGIETNAITVPRDTVNQVIAAMGALRKSISALTVMADRWPLGDHALRLPARRDFAELALSIHRVTKGTRE